MDLVFSPIVRSYVRQLTQAAGYEDALIARMITLDVRYNNDIRYLAVLLKRPAFIGVAL